jgi:mono/diheme cytochrome c family protein
VERQINTTKQTDLNQNEIKRMKKLIVISLVLFVAGAVSVRAADAKELWEKNCAKCHGADGAGKTKMGEKLGVKDYTDAKVQESLKDAEMTKAIKEGVKEKDSEKTKMKAFSDLSDDEIKALVAQVRSFKK